MQPLGEPSCPSCGTGNSHLCPRSNISGFLGVPGALPAQPPHSSTRVPPWNCLEHSMITSWDLPTGQEITSVLVWHAGAQFIQREMHGFVSSFKGKTPSQIKLAPCTSRVVSLLCTIPSSPCCSLKCIPGKPRKAPRTWKSDTLQAHGMGSGWVPSSPAELSFSDGPRWSLPWMGVVGWILGGNGEVG